MNIFYLAYIKLAPHSIFWPQHTRRAGIYSTSSPYQFITVFIVNVKCLADQPVFMLISIFTNFNKIMFSRYDMHLDLKGLFVLSCSLIYSRSAGVYSDNLTVTSSTSWVRCIDEMYWVKSDVVRWGLVHGVRLGWVRLISRMICRSCLVLLLLLLVSTTKLLLLPLLVLRLGHLAFKLT